MTTGRIVAWCTISCAHVFLPIMGTAVGAGYDDGLFDWSGGDDDDIDFDDGDSDDDDDLAPVRSDGISAGKMISFFAKLNSLRRKRLENRRKSAAVYRGGGPYGTARHRPPPPALPDSDFSVTAESSPEGDHRILPAVAGTLLPLTNRETGRKGNIA